MAVLRHIPGSNPPTAGRRFRVIKPKVANGGNLGLEDEIPSGFSAENAIMRDYESLTRGLKGSRSMTRSSQQRKSLFQTGHSRGTRVVLAHFIHHLVERFGANGTIVTNLI